MGSFQGRPQRELGVSSICWDAAFINPIYSQTQSGPWDVGQRTREWVFFYRATLVLTWCDILCQRTTFTLLSWPWAPGRKPSWSAQVEDKLIDTWFHRGRWTTDEAAPADLSKAARTRQGPRAESFVYEHGFGAVALSLRPVWLRFNKAFLGLLRYSSSYFSI